MSQYNVQLEELRVMAEYFVSAELPYFEELREAFRLLRITGCRIQEIFEIYRWQRISGYQFEVIPQKKNSPRAVILDDTFSDFMSAVDGQFSPFLGRTYSQLQYLFSKINPYGKLYSGGKEITNYFFRYLYVRELDELGLTAAQIADEMGYSSTQAVNNYLSAELGSTNEVPVTPPDPYPEGHIDIISEPYFFNGIDNFFLIDNPVISDTFSVFYISESADDSGSALIASAEMDKMFIYPYIQVAHPVSWITYLHGIGKQYGGLLSSLSYNSTRFARTPVVSVFQTISEPNGKYISRTTTHSMYVADLFSSVRTATDRGSPPLFASSLVIGGKSNSGAPVTDKYKGTISSLRFWNRALTASEVQNLLNL